MRTVAAVLLLMFGQRPAATQPIVPPTDNPRPVVSLEKDCVPFPDLKRGPDDFDIADCRPTRIGRLGVVDGRTYSFVLYCIVANFQREHSNCDDAPGWNRGLAVFSSSPGSATASQVLVRANPDGLIVESVDFVKNALGTFLVLTMSGEGTSQPNLSEFFRWDEAKRWWQPIAFEENRLLKGVERRGLTFTGCGPSIDVARMTVDFDLHSPDDAHCSATAVARVRMTIRENRFEATSFRFVR